MSSDTDIAPGLELLEPAFEITEAIKQQRITSVYISKDIGPASDYIELISRLRNAAPHDIFYIHLNTPGGYVDTGVQIINAMRDCPARIITVLDGTVCSMGSLIFLAADEYIVHENCRLMFHNYSGGVFGKGHEQIEHLTSTSNWFTNMLVEICSPFLSDDELSEVIAGRDIWLDSTEVRERLENVVKVLEEQRKAEEAEKERAERVSRKKELAAELKRLEKLDEKEAKAAQREAEKLKKAEAREVAKMTKLVEEELLELRAFAANQEVVEEDEVLDDE